MMLLPAATDTPAASGMVMLVPPLLLPVAVPMFLTKAMPARASDAPRPSRRASASVARARRAGLLDESTVIAISFAHGSADRSVVRGQRARNGRRRRTRGPTFS